MRLPPYSAYKPSGVEWLGEVPAHWEARRLRNVADIRFSNVDKHSKEGEKAVRLCNYTDVYHNDRIHSEMDFMRATATDDEIGRFQLAVGDVLITKDSESWNDIGVPALVESTDTDLVCGYHLALVRPNTKKIDGKFLSAALSCPNVAVQLHVCANGVTRFGLSQNSIKSAWLPRPPLPEQTAIARFLDHATDQIERYIRAKEKLIALLEEQKQVMIHDAVTGQIDVRTGQPYPTYKPSGVEWLEEVPAHWKVVPLKRIGKFQSGSGFPVAIQGDTEQEILFMKVSDMNSVGNEIEISHAANTVSSEVALQLGAQVFEHNTIVFPKVGGALLTNKRRLLARSTCIDNNLMACVVTGAKLDYVFLLLVWLNLGRMAQPGPVPAINEGEVREIRVALPPPPEQITIARFLNNIITNRAEAIERANREVDLLREYRSRLIADVVTGKLDVREAAANLPELEAIADGRDETIAAEPDSQQSNTTLHPPTTPGVGS